MCDGFPLFDRQCIAILLIVDFLIVFVVISCGWRCDIQWVSIVVVKISILRVRWLSELVQPVTTTILVDTLIPLEPWSPNSWVPGWPCIPPSWSVSTIIVAYSLSSYDSTSLLSTTGDSLDGHSKMPSTSKFSINLPTSTIVMPKIQHSHRDMFCWEGPLIWCLDYDYGEGHHRE